jgi:hypothetical protein
MSFAVVLPKSELFFSNLIVLLFYNVSVYGIAINAHGAYKIFPSPNVEPPIFFTQFQERFSRSLGIFFFEHLHDMGWRIFRRNRRAHMDMVLGDRSFKGLYIKSFAKFY